jgi:predicted dehydrogenase
LNNKTLVIGLAGCGHLGKIHVKLINDLVKTNNNLKFAGVYDTDTKLAEETAALYNVKAFGSLNELLEAVNTLVIVTPTSTHFEIAEQAINKNIHVFIEKPVTSSLSQAESLIGLSKKHPVKIQVGHVERFNPALTALEKLEMKPMFIESHRLAQFNPRGTDVSVIQDLMIHDIDIILHLAGSAVEKIDANGVAVISDEIDIANARLKLKNGCVANLTASRISLKKMRKMRIFQNNAYISIDFLNNKSEIFRLTPKNSPDEGMSFPISDEKKILYSEAKAENPENANPIRSELYSFFESIQNDSPCRVTLESGKEAVEVADKIIEIIKNTQN